MITEEENDNFECMKCGYEYSSYYDSEYSQCTLCFIMSCKNCRIKCEECNSNCCLRCSIYFECCDKNKCCNCYSYCENDNDYECDLCIIQYKCKDCEYYTCENYISEEHNNKYCIDCSYKYCVLCDNYIFYSDNEQEDNDYFPNPCINCQQEIENILLKTEIELPEVLIKKIIEFITEF